VPHNARMRMMPINIDWLGDGWTYYPDDERKRMDSNAPKRRKWTPADITSVLLPATKIERLKLASAAAGSLGLMVLPTAVGRKILDSIAEGGVPKHLWEEMQRFVEAAEEQEDLNDAMNSRDMN
jgi:hypothetical protein